MTPKPVTLHKQDRLENVLDLMRRHNISKVPVVDDGHIVGIVSDGDLLEELGAFKNKDQSPTSLHVSTAMQRDFHAVTPDTDLKVVIEQCKGDGVSLIPVVEKLPNEKLLGVITKADLLKLVASPTPLRDLMKTQLRSVMPGERLIHARRLMVDHGIERLPVLDGGRLVGIVSELDIALALDEFKKKWSPEVQKSRIKDLVVDDVMKSQVVTAPPDLPAKRAAELMRQRDVGGLPVVTGPPGENHIAGMVTRTDLIRTL